MQLPFLLGSYRIYYLVNEIGALGVNLSSEEAFRSGSQWPFYCLSDGGGPLSTQRRCACAVSVFDAGSNLQVGRSLPLLWHPSPRPPPPARCPCHPSFSAPGISPRATLPTTRSLRPMWSGASSRPSFEASPGADPAGRPLKNCLKVSPCPSE